MDSSVIIAIIEGVVGLLVSVVGTVGVVLANRIKRQKEAEEKRAELRKQESYLSLEMINATMELSYACCNALCGGTNNGNVAKAKEKMQKASEKYLEFERKTLTSALHDM